MRKTSQPRWISRTRHDLIIEVWEKLDCESVGKEELEQIQRALHEKFGEGALESPASIARTVADEGAVLRHPEVFAFDYEWRKQKLEESSLPEDLSFASLSAAFESFSKLEDKRLGLQADKNEKGLKQLRDVITAARTDSALKARSKIIESTQRDEAKEISQWLTVWLQSPQLFPDWLDLRRRSPEFRKRFSEG